MYKISIVDDDEEAMLHLEMMLHQYGDRRNLEFDVHKFNEPKEYLKSQDSDSDIIFLDIKMSEMNGLSLAKKIRVIHPNVIIIFCTSFQRFAINGYEVNAFGFIVKPVQEYSLNFFLDRAIKKLKNKGQEKIIRVKALEDYKVLRIQDIYYVEVARHHLFYHVKPFVSRSEKDKDKGTEEVVQTRGTMKEVEKQLEGCDFCRCSVSYLVNLEHITAIKGNDVYLSETVLPISRNQKKAFNEQFMQFISKKGIGH